MQSLPPFMGNWIQDFGLADDKERRAKPSKPRSKLLPVSVARDWSASSLSSKSPWPEAAEQKQKALLL